MAKKVKRTIYVDEKDFSVKDVIDKLDKGEAVPVEHQIAAMVKLRRTLAKFSEELKTLEMFKDDLENKITTQKYEGHIQELVNRGKLYSSTDVPVIEITNKDGSVYEVTMSSGLSESFSIDAALSEKKILDGLEEKYKKTTISLDKKVIRGEFEAGTLPNALAMFVSKTSTDVTKLKVTCKAEPTNNTKSSS